MKDLWEELNDDIPFYFNELAKEYSLKFVRVHATETALATSKFALLIALDRFTVRIDYVFRQDNGELLKYACDSFLAEKYDDNDRRELRQGINAKELIINEFIISRNGLKSKWNKILQGNTDWFEDFQKSRWYSSAKLSKEEMKILDRIIQ